MEEVLPMCTNKLFFSDADFPCSRTQSVGGHRETEVGLLLPESSPDTAREQYLSKTGLTIMILLLIII